MAQRRLLRPHRRGGAEVGAARLFEFGLCRGSGPEESPYAARAALLSADGSRLSADGSRLSARELAREILPMTQEEFSAAFKGSPMKRAKLRGLKRNAAVVLGNVGTSDDVGRLARLRDEEPDDLVREHAAWTLAQIGESS